MFIIAHLPDGRKLNFYVSTTPQLGNSLNRCYHCDQDNKCVKNCNKCCTDEVVEMFDDGTEVWIDFLKSKGGIK